MFSLRVFQGCWNRTRLYLSNPQRPSLCGSLWVADGLCRSFNCVSIWSFTIFHGLSQNCATLSDPQRPTKTHKDYMETRLYVEILPLIEKRNQSITMYFIKLEIIFGQKWISKVKLEIIYLEITLLMSKLLKHANYLNAVLRPGVPRQQIAEV